MSLMAIVAYLTLGACTPQFGSRGLALGLGVLRAGDVGVRRDEERTRAAAARERIERVMASL